MQTRTVIPLLALLAAPAAAQFCSIQRLSLDMSGVEGDGPSQAPVITPDGRFVAFASSATNLVAGDTNGVADIFVRDLVLGTIERVSVGPGGAECDFACASPALSDDGRFVAFQSSATTLVPGGTNGFLDVYVLDRSSGLVERVSRGPHGLGGNGPSFGAALTADARYVTFVSWASDLVAGDANATRDVFLVDRLLGTTELVSVSTAGVLGNDMSGSSALLSFTTHDGRFVLFGSTASNLVAGDTNVSMDVFVRDRVLGTTSLLVSAPGGGVPNGWTDLGSMTRDGRYVGFASSAADLVPLDTNGMSDAFVLDRSSGVVERVNLDDQGAQSSGDAWPPVVSQDGRFAVFTSGAADLVLGDGNARRDVFRRDRLAGTTEMFVLSWVDAQPQFDVYGFSITAAADACVFAYVGDDLMHSDANGASDVFLRACVAGSAFCSGDGSAAACPCGVGPVGAGCPHSAGSGARLVGSGRARTTGDTLALLARDLPGNTTVAFLSGSTQQGGGAGTTFGDGLRCVGGSIVTLGIRPSSGGAATWGFGVPGAPLLSVQGNVPLGGDVRLYQAWYRNAALYCTPAMFNLTNGLEILWLP